VVAADANDEGHADDAAAPMRRDFRAWLAWRDEDAARARAAAEATARDPAALVGADPSQFRLDGNVGGIVKRERIVPERERLATKGIVWMHEPSHQQA